MFCEKCGAILTEYDKFCSKCGTPTVQKQAKRYCTGCGAELTGGQLFCTNCGMKFSENRQDNTGFSSVKENMAHSTFDATNEIIKGFSPKYYSIGKITAWNSKQCGIVLRGDRIEVYQPSKFTMLLGGASVIAGAAECNIAASGKTDKTPIFTIPFHVIRNVEKGKFGFNKIIILTLNDGAVYTFAVDKDQDEIYNIIQSKIY